MVINHNLSAMYANRTLGITQTDVSKTMERLSSGYRINRAADDASGLAVSEKLRSQIRGLDQANRNIQNGVSFIQTAEGYLSETQDILHRLRELSVQSANGIYTSEDRAQIQVEVSQLVDEVNRIASHAQFNGMNILTGRFASGAGQMRLQVGANMDQFKDIQIGNMSYNALFTNQDEVFNVTEQIASVDGANASIGAIDTALQTVSKQRADLGAYQNRFETASEGIAIAAENMQAAESRIRDADVAKEMVDYTKDQILSQAGIAMLAQANVRNQSALQLLS